MPKPTARVALAFAVLVGLVAGVAAEPIEGLVPDTTFVLFRVRSGSDLLRKWRTTGYYAFLHHKELQAATGGPAQVLGGLSMQMSAQFGVREADLLALFENQFGLVVAQPELGAGTGVEFVGLFEAGEAGARVVAGVGELLRRQRRGRSPYENFEGVRILKLPFMGLAAADVKDMLIVASPLNAAKNAILRVKSPPQEPLATGRRYKAVVSKLTPDNDILWYVDVRGLLGLLRSSAGIPPDMAKTLSTLGVDSVARMGGSVLLEDGIHFRLYVELAGTRRGVFKLLPPAKPAGALGAPRWLMAMALAGVFSPNDPPERSREERAKDISEILGGKVKIKSPVYEPKKLKKRRVRRPKATQTPKKKVPARRRRTVAGALADVHRGDGIPDDVAGFASLKLDLEDSYKTLLQVGRVLHPKQTATVEKKLQEVARKTGRDSVDELLRLFGPRIVTYTRYVTPYAKPGAEQRVAFIQLKRRVATENLLAKLRKEDPSVFNPRRPQKVYGFEVYRMDLRDQEAAYCVTRSYLVWANNPRALHDYLRFVSQGDASLAESDRFALALGKLPPTSWQALVYGAPASAFAYGLALVRANRIKLSELTRDLPIPIDTAQMASGLRNIRNPLILGALLPVSMTAVAPEEQGVLIASYHTPGGEGG